jgi:hypothetical protein
MRLLSCITPLKGVLEKGVLKIYFESGVCRGFVYEVAGLRQSS